MTEAGGTAAEGGTASHTVLHSGRGRLSLTFGSRQQGEGMGLAVGGTGPHFLFSALPAAGDAVPLPRAEALQALVPLSTKGVTLGREAGARIRLGALTAAALPFP